MSTLYFQIEGGNGSDGINGQFGHTVRGGTWYQANDGGNGQNASCAQNGGSPDGTPLELVLRYSLMEETCKFKLSSGCEPQEHTTKLEDCPTVVITSLGGKGGNGGNGGGGGSGAHGRR